MTATNSHFQCHASPESTDTSLAYWWHRFVTKFPDDAECLEELYRRAGVEKCSHCGGDGVDRNRGDRTLRCQACGKKTWMTADTFFRRIKRPQAWLGRIWLFEHGVAVSSSRFHKLAGVTYDTARNIFKKLTAVIASHLEDECVPSALFAPVIGKRSLETPAGAHPRAEAEEMESKWRQTTSAFCPGGDGTGSSSSPAACQSDCKSDSEPELQAEASTVVNSPNPSDKLTEQDKRVYDCLSEKPVQFDSLCVKLDMKAGQLSSTLTMLELAGLAKSLAGNQYVCGKDREAAAASPASRPSRTSKTTSIVAGIIKFVRCHFHAVSWKYLQNYLAAHWCLIDRARWTCGSLLKACLRFGYITSSATLDHVSPLSVKISPCSQA